MAAFPISPLSPELKLANPSGSDERRLSPLPNIGVGLPGLAGIGQVEMPGLGIFSGPGLTIPQFPLPGMGQTGIESTPTISPPLGVQPAPQATPFPGVMVQPTTTPTPGPLPAPAPTAIGGLQAPIPAQTPVPATEQVQAPAQGRSYVTDPITTRRIPDVVQTPVQAPPMQPQFRGNPVADTFGQYLKDAVSNYNTTQSQADNMIQRLAVGDKVDIHDVTLAVQKAAITNQLAIQVRNRLVEAYQEVMRMSM